VTPDILLEHLPAPGPDTVIFLCGPPSMVDSMETALKAIGHSEKAIILP
jgi:ferredoxin-NADP reductase